MPSRNEVIAENTEVFLSEGDKRSKSHPPKRSMDSTKSEKVEVEIHSLNKRYGFKIDETNVLVPENEYCELIPNFNISLLPNSPKHMLGIINLRGNLIPLYKTSTSTSKVDKGTSAYAFLIGKPKYGAALLIYGKPKAIQMDNNAEKIEPTGISEWLKECITESITIDGKVWHGLNTRAFFIKLATTA